MVTSLVIWLKEDFINAKVVFNFGLIRLIWPRRSKFIWQKRLIKNLKKLAIYIWNYSKVQKIVYLCKNNVWTNLLSFRCSQSDIDSFLPLRSILTFEVKRLTSEVRNHTYNDWTVLVHLSWMFAKWYKFMRLTSGLRGQKS